MSRPARPWLLAGLLLGITVVVLLTIRFWPKPPTNSIPPEPPLRFADVTDHSGIAFRHFSGATGEKLLPETMGAGVAVIDFDRDGKPDLFFVNGRAWPGHPNPPGGPTTPVL